MNPPPLRSGPSRHHALPRGLYLITPDEPDTARLLERVGPVLQHAVALQYRNKLATDALRRTQVQALLPACRAAGLPLIVNDDWRLAVELGTDGAHMGGNDGDLAHARNAVADDFILGASCYDDPHRATDAARAGASYLAFGAFHPSPTKPHAPHADPDLLRRERRHGLPLVAIGGVTVDNAPALVAAGADLVAVISGVFDAADPSAAARAYAACFDLRRSTPQGTP